MIVPAPQLRAGHFAILSVWTNPLAPAARHSSAASPNLKLRSNASPACSNSSKRAGKRQVAPFARGSPKPNPKKPGRKPGKDYGTKAHRPLPEQIDEVHEVPLPDACPDCGGPIEQTHVDQQ